MTHHSVACFNLPDGDCVYLHWDPHVRKYYMMSTLDPTMEECTIKNVRRTIYWAMGEEPYTCDLPVDLDCLVLLHRELLKDGEPWTELCDDDQSADFLNQTWDSYTANRIFITFNVCSS